MRAIRKGKPGESRGRKAMGLKPEDGYDCQAAEDNQQWIFFSSTGLVHKARSSFWAPYHIGVGVAGGVG